MKKSVLGFAIAFLIILLTGCSFEASDNDFDTNSDAINFKEEYESLNGKIREKDGQEIRTIYIDEDNPFIYATAEDIVSKIENEESFVVYFGFADCPWCRSIVPSLTQASKDLNFNEIYYVDVSEIRDILILSNNNEVQVEKEGTENYYKLLDLLDNVLSDYELTDEANNKILTGEKRIYSPNVVAVVDGEAKELETGVSQKQTNAYMELTTEMTEESYNIFKCLIKCVVESKNTCRVEAAC